jgi:Sec-independent protein translocase protein TatA
MADVNLVAILVAVLGSGGLGAVVTSVLNSIRMARRGVSGREDKRRDDIIKQRDEAWARARQAEADADREEARADRERGRRIRWMELAARYRLQLISAGIEPTARWIDEPDMKE